MLRLAIPSLALLLSLSGPAWSEEAIYQYRAQDGSTVFSDRRNAPADATRAAPSQPHNSYQPPAPKAQPMRSRSGELNSSQARNTRDTSREESQSPRDCEAEYGMSCERVDNWRRHALQDCRERGDDRCQDPTYLERRYKPRPLAETRAVARRAAIRGNNLQARAMRDLQLFYSDYCEQRLQSYCSTASDPKNCREKHAQRCGNGEDLEAVLRKYQQLSPEERAKIHQYAEKLEAQETDRFSLLFKDLLDLLRLPLL